MKITIKIIIFLILTYNGYSNIDSLYKSITFAEPLNKFKLYKKIIKYKLDNLDYSAKFDLDSALNIAKSLNDELKITEINILFPVITKSSAALT